MYRTKKDVDKHVESLISKLSAKEFKTRAYSVSRLYFDVGDYVSCQKYVEQYLTQKDNNAAAHKLLGQALQKLGQKENALEHYKTSLDIDPTQTSTILEICELLADDEVIIDPGRAKYWCDKAEAMFPRHPVTFRLRGRLVIIANPDPEALVNLLTAELAIRPKDALLHARLLKHYLLTNQIKEAFDHSCKVEFGENSFLNNYSWYDTVSEVLKHNLCNTNDWLYHLLLLTVRERICGLSLTEIPAGSSKSLIESCEHLHAYDQAIETVAKAGAQPGFGEFHASLLQHHKGQFAFHSATFLLKKAKKDQLSWRDATRLAAPLMLIAWQTVPLNSKVNWLTHAPEKQQRAIKRWYIEGACRCSQSGHYLLSNFQDKSQSFLDRISQCCSGAHWRDKLYEKLFTSRDHLAKIKTSHFVSNAYGTPILRLPRKAEVEAYDEDAQREYANSLHHFIWTLLNYKNYAQFKCILFEMLTPTTTNCGPETLNKQDVHAFLYCATLTTRQQKSTEIPYVSSDKPQILPANITDLLCSLPQMKWWDCAYKFSQNKLGTELTDIRATLSRGIEVVRCVDNHGLDPELLCILGGIFNEQAKCTTVVEEKSNLEIRACLYYSSAMPLLEKLKSKIIFKMPEKRMFDYTHKELGMKELTALIEESKLYVAVCYYNDCEYEKVIEMLSSLKSPQAYFHLGQTFKKIALVESNFSKENLSIEIESKSTYALLSKAKSYAYKALDRIRDTEVNKNHPLYVDIQHLIEEVETHLSKMDPDLSCTGLNDIDGKYSSDENVSTVSGHIPSRNNYQLLRNFNSTPKQAVHANVTHYRTAVDSQILESNRVDQQSLERIENQIKSLHKRFTDDFTEQTKNWFDDNRRLGNQIMSTIQTDLQNTNELFKLLKISVDQVKDQMNDCRNECKDVGDLKKQIAELKKEVNKLKKASSEQTIDDSDLYNLDDDYRTNESTSAFAAQLPFQTPQVMPQFNQRLIPPFSMQPNPYQLYSQNLYNLYSQYSQFAQSPAVPAAPPLFDPTRAPVNYSGVYPTPDQMYLDVAHLVPPTVPPVPAVPTLPTVTNVPVVSIPPVTPVSAPKAAATLDAKEIPRSLPVNVVITSSDPLPTTSTTTPAPILSVIIPPKHIKGSPHNYQIAMPSINETKVISPPVFSFPTSGNKTSSVTTASSLSNWAQSPVFKTTSTSATTGTTPNSSFFSSKVANTPNNSMSVVDGVFIISPDTSLNKSRTLSERSNTSIENYDPCPDFKPIIPLPAEVQVTTGEEDEYVVFSARAKLFRFVDKQWKERGIGEMKLLKHKATGKVRVLMRREQIHKICANHIITPEMEIKPMKNETKAYFWVANDFADETVVLEKFSIRFKTADIAQNFFETFETARLESKVTTLETGSDIKANPIINPGQTTTTKTTVLPDTSQQNKTQFGGFTFSSTPAFKNAPDITTESKPSEPVTSKVNVFSGLSFKTTSSSTFGNIFTTSANQVNTIAPIQSQETPNKLNTSDVAEEFESTAEFKPVVPLPALIDQKTGEEDETILFEHRAKLLRFDASSKEWKERGLGNIKVLVHKDNIQKLRLLMRREQIMKVCCNHAVTKDMIFQKMPNIDKAVTWCAKDFSEGELVAETFCLRFKTTQACDEFMETLKIAQSKMKDDTKAAKEEQNAAKQSNQTGFGDKFKSKPGSWHCDTCYTNNLESFTNCACCEQPKPQTNVSASDTSASVVTWGDKFKPKPGSWECNSCLVRNEASVEYCSACNSPKDPSGAKIETKSISADTTPKFNFGIPLQASNVPTNVTSTPAVKIMPGWEDKFKPKEGTWECTECFVRNENLVEICIACYNPKNPSTKSKEEQSTFVNITSGPKFSFGIPPATANAENRMTETTSIFDGTGAHKFSFGIPNQGKESQVVSFGDQQSSIFGISKTSTDNDGPINLSSKTKEDQNKALTAPRPALLPTPTTDNTAFSGKGGGTFDFVFKPKTPPKGKSPVKSPRSQKGDESDGNEYASDDEGHDIHFSPVIPMPEKVNVVTGEENETELYGHRAKLYRFISGEWKERGIGVVKILKHKDTDKLRVVMRREQVLKICLNHALTLDISYSPKDDKTWLFAANDFSEGELSVQQFCLRFKNKEIALEFKDAVDNSRDGKLVAKKDSESGAKDTASDDVVFINEIQATAEEKQAAKKLMLPENFYTYKTKTPCQGCRGCEDDEDVKPYPAANAAKLAFKSPPMISESLVSTPVKNTISFASPINYSLYGTPANFDRTLDTDVSSMFRTPLGSIASNTSPASPFTPNQSISENDTTDKENTFIHKNIFTGEQSSGFATPQNTPTSAAKGETSSKNVILAAPKLSSLNTSGGEQQSSEPKSVFSAVQVKTLFGSNNTSRGEQQGSEHKSIFGATQTKTLFGDNNTSGSQQQSSESKSVFGAAHTKTLFGDNNASGGQQQRSDSKSIFGAAQTKTLFGEKKSIFGIPNTSSGDQSQNDDSPNAEVKSIFGVEDKPVNLFSSAAQGSIFGPGALANNKQKTNSAGIIESSKTTVSGTSDSETSATLFRNAVSESSKWNFGVQGNTDVTATNVSSDKKTDEIKPTNEREKAETLFNVDKNLSFAALSTTTPEFSIQKKPDFQWEGAGQQLFGVAQRTPNKEDRSKNESAADDSGTAGAEEDYDPHYEPIVPLPDKIVVTTGEEDEEKLFGERCKLYRYDDQTREWKERGVGEMKVLYHPERKTYRLLLRREQVHKAVLNMLLFMDLELLPMKNSDRAWTWAGRNYAENPAGEQETLAVRFKSVDLAAAFHNKVVESVRKLQAVAAQVIKEEKESAPKMFTGVAPLRLPKHLEDSARIVATISTPTTQQAQSTNQATDTTERQNGQVNKTASEVFKQVQFREPEEVGDEDEEEDYEHDYQNEDYEAYYNDDEEESAAYYSCYGEIHVQCGEVQSTCENGHVQVLFDQEIYSPKIMLTDADTGEILADMLIHTDTEFHISGDSCSWSGTDYTSNDPVDKSVTVNFFDSESAMQFYDSCETSKAATFTSTDPES